MIGTFIDQRDGRTYRTIQDKSGLIWLGEHLKFNLNDEGCFYYNDDPINLEEHGMLYTWEAATRACPPGWRLPKNKEWRRLAKIGYSNLVPGGASKFDLTLSGIKSIYGEYVGMGTEGVFWSGTNFGSKRFWFFGLDSSHPLVSLYYAHPFCAFSARCVLEISLI